MKTMRTIGTWMPMPTTMTTMSTTFGRVGLTLALLLTITACTESANRMSGAALPQEAPPAAADVSAGAAASDTLAGAPDGASIDQAPVGGGMSEAANPWGALAVSAGEAAVGEADAAAVPIDAGADTAADTAADTSAPAGDSAAAGAAGAAVETAADAAAAQPDALGVRPSGLPSTGSPAACKTLLKPIDDALKAGGSAILAVTLMPANGAYVGYAEGEVKRVGQLVAAGSPARTSFNGNMWQQFSDRQPPSDGTITKLAGGGRATPTGPVMPTSYQLFSQQRLDKLGVSMDTATGNTNLTLYSWENAVVRLTPTCENGMLYGYGDGKLYALTLRWTRPLPTPRPVMPLP